MESPLAVSPWYCCILHPVQYKITRAVHNSEVMQEAEERVKKFQQMEEKAGQPEPGQADAASESDESSTFVDVSETETDMEESVNGTAESDGMVQQGETSDAYDTDYDSGDSDSARTETTHYYDQTMTTSQPESRY